MVRKASGKARRNSLSLIKDTVDLMEGIVIGVVGKRLRYKDLVEDNVLPSRVRV